MKRALDEATLLVFASARQEQPWPILYANKSWSDACGTTIMPPQRFPGESKATGSGMGCIQGGEHKTSLNFFDWFTLSQQTETTFFKDFACVNRNSPRVFNVAGKIPLPSTDPNSTSFITLPVDCRMVPAEFSLDVSSAAIKVVLAQNAFCLEHNLIDLPGYGTGSLHFVTVALKSAADAASRKPPTPQADERGSVTLKQPPAPGTRS